jgi:hypothetical protein
MDPNPIAEIKKELGVFHDLLKKNVPLFQIPKDTAEEVLELPWETFQEYTGDFIGKGIWEQIQSKALIVGGGALDGLQFGPTTIKVGEEYAVWNGLNWVTCSALTSPEIDQVVF